VERVERIAKAPHFIAQPVYRLINASDVGSLVVELALHLSAEAFVLALGCCSCVSQDLHLSVLHAQGTAVLRDLRLQVSNGVKRHVLG
jgi:hypothetical protein